MYFTESHSEQIRIPICNGKSIILENRIFLKYQSLPHISIRNGFRGLGGGGGGYGICRGGGGGGTECVGLGGVYKGVV